MSDMSAEEWKNYVCVEAGVIENPVVLAPKHSWEAEQYLGINNDVKCPIEFVSDDKGKRHEDDNGKGCEVTEHHKPSSNILWESEKELALEKQYDAMAIKMRDPQKGVEVKDRKWYFKTFKECFVGRDLVEWMLKEKLTHSREAAVEIGRELQKRNYLAHVTRDHDFKDENLFYRFALDTNPYEEGKSWTDLYKNHLETLGAVSKSSTVLPELKTMDADMISTASELEIFPLDQWNIKLLDNVHPKAYINPTPKDTYNLVVIGAGAGGLVAAASAAGCGAKVAIIEQHLMGGDCLNVGCVPSKALIAASYRVHQIRTAKEFGIEVGDIKVDFAAIMERMRRLRAKISSNDSVKRFSENLNIEVHLGHAVFTNKNVVSVAGKSLKFAKAIVATGATAAIPPIPGINDVNFLTNSTIFNLTELPLRFGVIGAGAVGCELAQTFARFGSKTTIFARSPTIMSREDPQAVEVVTKVFIEDGIEIETCVEYTSIYQAQDGIYLTYSKAGKNYTKIFDQVLVATGRAPCVNGLGLEMAGVKYDTKQGIIIADTLTTSNPNIFAIGDCCTQFKFTHVSDAMARIVVRNALFFGSDKWTNLTIPWCTFTHPELAHVGPYESDLKKKGIEYDVYKVNFEDNDRSILDSKDEGFVKIYTFHDSDRVIAGTIVGEGAGNMISEITLLITQGIGLLHLAGVIHPYPTSADAVRRCGDLYNKTRLTTFVKVLFRNLLAARR